MRFFLDLINELFGSNFFLDCVVTCFRFLSYLASYRSLVIGSDLGFCAMDDVILKRLCTVAIAEEEAGSLVVAEQDIDFHSPSLGKIH